MSEGTTPEIVDIQKQVENLKKTLGDSQTYPGSVEQGPFGGLQNH